MFWSGRTAPIERQGKYACSSRTSFSVALYQREIRPSQHWRRSRFSHRRERQS